MKEGSLYYGEKPLVTIVVPVYNSEKYLRICLDSLVSQSLDNIEIIAVDDGSVDESLAILEDYKKKFPGKVIIYTIPHVHGAGAPRNFAIEKARADYIGFCDADDVMDVHSMELLYCKAKEKDYDIVCAPAFHVNGDKRVLYGQLKEPISTETLILNGQVYLWNKIIHKRLLNKVGRMPENVSLEDLGYSLVLHSYARKIGYIEYPVYYYMKRFGSDSNNVFTLRNLDTIQARQYALDKCNPEYKEYVAAYVARHINSDFRKRWIFTDRFIEQLKDIWVELKDNKILKSDEYLYRRLEKFAEISNVPIPRNIFIGGIGVELSDGFIRSCKENAFYDSCTITILNEKNCDINELEILKEAYENNDFDFLNGYFALKFILKEGGIYLDRRIIIDRPFNYVRYCRAFFALLDEETYSDWVFGGISENEAMSEILETYKNADRFKYSLDFLRNKIKDTVERYEVPKSEVNNLIDYPITVFSPDVMVCDITTPTSLKPEPHVCTHDFTSELGERGIRLSRKQLCHLY
ncbi:glycosyltransferase family 2 protein [Paenibacillus sonchi]|uniref:Glycosyltransferase family 2 protein n=1 Tax=Paenibacillus sonchi TaxID=373687 RepID=A0A974SEF3_9BACL|nr:glycosyltransferase family 2 protein [Paenibacillus sonchi]QQZ62201.1 glycosyltransferase family 2 protein [Paenibacillus sonchi]